MFIEVLESNRTRDGLGVKDLGLGRSAVPRMDDQERSFARLAMQLCRSRKLRSAIARQHVSGVTSTGSTSRVAASIAGRKGVAYKGNSRAARKSKEQGPPGFPGALQSSLHWQIAGRAKLPALEQPSGSSVSSEPWKQFH